METEASWVPGYVAIPEIPGPLRLRLVNNIPSTNVHGLRVGGRSVFRLGYGQDNWFHFAIPTPVIDDGVRVRLERFFVLYAAQAGVYVISAHIWDGPNRKRDYAGFAYTGNHSAAIDAQNSEPSAHCEKIRHTPLRWAGYNVGSGCTCSSTSQISAVSQ